MKAQDVISLALKGYKISEIKELVELANSVEVEETTDHEDNPSENESGGTDEHGAESNDKESEDTTDYKSLYEKEQKKVLELQKKAQHKDIDIGEPKSEEETFSELIKNVFK